MNLKTFRLQQVAEQARPNFTAFHAKALEQGFRLLIVRAWSSLAEQEAIYRVGRVQNEAGAWVVADEKAIRSKAKPGQSLHNICRGDGAPASLAIDVIPLDGRGVPLWEMPGEKARDLEVRWVQTYDLKEMEAWEALYELAVKEGLDPLGDPRGAYLRWDKCHIQLADWRTKMKAWGLVMPVSTLTVAV